QTLGQQLAYSYDPRGNVVQMTGPGGVTEYLYDAANRLVEQRDPVSGVFRFTYNAAGQRHQTHYPNGVVSRRGYDQAGRLTEGVSHNAAGELIDGFHYGYDAAGRVVSKNVLPTGVAASHTYAYDLRDRLERWQRGAGRFVDFTYDDAGNRRTATDELGVTTYSYDAADRLLATVRALDAGGSVTTTNTW
ncbi:MAG: RHS repeat protein, partial [Lentisphaerae bacterium]|nr:RHS repeat protein [Lentisphaerota bacterium]